MITKEELLNFTEEIKEIYEAGKIHSPIHLSGTNEDKLMFSRLKVRGLDRYIDITYEWHKPTRKYRMFTDELKYGDHLEIVCDKRNQNYTVKYLDKLRAEWRKKHPNVKECIVEDDVLEGFIQEVG